MSLDRREFLKRSLVFVPAAGIAPAMLVRAAAAAPGGSTKNLVLIELDGGNDGMNTLVPYGLNGGAYYTEFRPTIGIPAGSVLDLGGGLGLNPGLTALKARFDAGRLAVIPGVGYPDPDFSHEVSQSIWATGDPTGGATDGWLGRMLAQFPVPSFPCALDLDGHLDKILVGSGGFVPAFSSIGQFNFPYDPHAWSDKENRRVAYEAAVDGLTGSGGLVGTMSDTSKGMLGLIDTLQSIPEFTHVGDYPSHYVQNALKLIARLMQADLGLRIFHVPYGGFDTHGDQELDGYHTNRLQIISDGVQALYDDLATIGEAANTLFVFYSEFGRTIHENGSAGTDHGSTSVMFVVGDGVTGGVTTAHPPVDPTQLGPDGELQRTTDFRDVFGTIASKWYGADVTGLFPGHTVVDLGFLP
ncbi:MAG: DUF1501 domain-containing protein [Planctomycetota bacterium JB042]